MFDFIEAVTNLLHFAHDILSRTNFDRSFHISILSLRQVSTRLFIELVAKFTINIARDGKSEYNFSSKSTVTSTQQKNVYVTAGSVIIDSMRYFTSTKQKYRKSSHHLDCLAS